MTHEERMKLFGIDTNSPAYKAGQKLAERLVARKFERIDGKWFVADTVDHDPAKP